MASSQRALAFKLLSRIFSYPSEQCIREIDSLADELASKSTLMLERLNFHDLYIALEEEKSKLVEECDRLIFDEKNSMCSPYETSYRSDEKESLLNSIRAIYSSAKFVAGDKPLDHISTELEFISHTLTVPDIESSRRDEILVKFMINHLLKWVSRFAKCVQDNTKLSFYKLASQALIKLIEMEREYLGIP